MKTKIFALLALIAILLSFTSCLISPKVDYNKAKVNLKSANYFVSVSSEDSLEKGLINYFKATSRDSDDYIKVFIYESAEQAKIAYKRAKIDYNYELDCIKTEIEYTEYILDNYADELSENELEQYLQKLEDLNKKLINTKYLSFGINENTVWSGTTVAIKDAIR